MPIAFNVSLWEPMGTKGPGVDQVLQALKQLRVAGSDDEYRLQNEIASCLDAHKIGYIKEYRISPNCRIDFFLSGIGLEVKKGKPPRSQVLRQVSRYLRHRELEALILVTERAQHLPPKVEGKDCISVCLSKLWGVAL